MRRGKKRALRRLVWCVERLTVVVDDIAQRIVPPPDDYELAKVRKACQDIRDSLLPPRPIVYDSFEEVGTCYDCRNVFADLKTHRKVKHGLP